MELFSTVTVLLVLLAQSEAENSTHNGPECIMTDIATRLGIASKILETVKQKLPSDLSELCNQNFNCPECKNRTDYVKPMDCSDLYHDGERRDGIYDVWPQSRLHRGPITVYCDMESNGGGWTVIQRRGDYKSGTDYFFQEWNSYKRGFGDKLKDFWIGNDNLFGLTNRRTYQLRVNMSDWEGKSAHAIYDEFWIADELHNYTLHLKGYRGTAGDSLGRHDGYGFCTKDRDDKHDCAAQRKGAWWYNGCSDSNLNGLYEKGNTSHWMKIVFWEKFRGPNYSLKDTVMKIRPNDFDVKSPT